MAVNLTADTTRCAYRIFKDNGAYGIAINVADDTAAAWSDASNYNLYINGTANITSNLNVGGTIIGGSFTPTNPLAIEYGGTGATTATGAWTALGGGASGKHADSYFALASHEHSAGDITSGTLPIARGGTNATTAANARTQLGITPANIGAKATQTAISDPAYDGDSITFINTISQNAQGVITPHKAIVRSASTTLNGIVTIDAQSFAGNKTFTDIITSTYAGNGFQLKHGTANKDCYFYAERTDTSVKVGLGVGSGGTNHGVYSFTVGTWMVYASASTIFANIQTFNKEATFATNVTVTGSIDIQTAWGYLRWKKSIGNNDISGLIAANNATTTDPARFSFYQYILDSSGNHITDNVYERFLLPAVTTTRTASKDFSILTSKSAVTIAQGGTGKTTATEAWTALGGGASGKHADSYFALASHNHAAGDITSGTLGLARGGTGVTANPSMLTNLASTTAAGVFAASPRPGVTGILPVAHGGTGASAAEVGTITYTTNSHIASVAALSVYRVGKMGVLLATGQTLKAYGSSSYIGVGTIGAGWRPKVEVTQRVPLASGNWILRITTGGVIQFNKSTTETGTFYTTMIFPIAD